MKKYRIITNGNQYKVQIRRWLLFVPVWCTLQEMREPSDITLNTYQKAEQVAIKYIAKENKANKRWKVAHYNRDFHNTGLPKPDPDLRDTI